MRVLKPISSAALAASIALVLSTPLTGVAVPTSDPTGTDSTATASAAPDPTGENTAAPTGSTTSEDSSQSADEQAGASSENEDAGTSGKNEESAPQGTGSTEETGEETAQTTGEETTQATPRAADTVAISDIQANPKNYKNKQVTIQGIVTAVWDGRDGFTVQMPTSEVPEGYERSQAVFVKLPNPSKTLHVGDEVKVDGKVSDPNGVTTLTTSAKSIETLGSEKTGLVKPAQVAAPKTPAEANKIQSMVINPQGQFRLTDTYKLPTTGQISLTDGDKAPAQPTQVGTPGSAEAKAQAQYNETHLITVDDGSDDLFDSNSAKAQVTPPKHLPFVADDAKAGPTLGAEVTFKSPAVITYTRGKWVLDPTTSIPAADEFISFSDVAEAEPATVGGNFKVATFNVLNYFTSLGVNSTEKDKNGKPLCAPVMNRWDQSVPVAGNWDCPLRGAWDESGLKRQEDKIVAAINTLGKQNAAVVALQEIENDKKFETNPNQSLEHLVKALNQADPNQKWNYVPTPKKEPAFGTDDAIRQAFLYRSSVVDLVGDAEYAVSDQPQAATQDRAPLTQVFEHKASGKKVLVVNNHFKSKGSQLSGADNSNPGKTQGPAYDVGNNNGERTRQAKDLLDVVNKKVKAVKPDFSVLVGDFNSYSGEDPIRVLKQQGFTDLMNTAEHPTKRSMTDWAEYTYAYGGMLGSLDHIMVSKPGMSFYKGHDIWTANAYENQARQYSNFMATGTNYYNPNVFRASDHNSAIVGFDLEKSADTETPGTGNPGSEKPNQPGAGNPGANNPDQPGNNNPGSKPGVNQPTSNQAGKPGSGSVNANQSSGHIARTGSTASTVILLSALALAIGGGAWLLKRRIR
ncbi:ExeM/NucH family extracellular endonuclease [Gleimia hominis]|uniref:ExeM/NucH family extracellular endonuclease n=1 Tax=Gleimia hominis TaxID=595468 RepID=A0ABU3I8N8_9ACTO|nr:ExeM/NucH family extracellular endonuclease [Gleimia hominis]MDT3766741.1 ExeM/NucH family extracellular endonuclease [Gleimia hominis]